MGWMMEVLDTLRSVYAQSTAYAARRKADGQRIVGYFGDAVPVELIAATGALPLRITGFPAPSPDVLDDRLYALLPKGFWQVRQSSLEFLNHSFGRLVDGSYAMLDALVIPNTRKTLLNVATQLRAAAAADPALQMPHLIIIDRAATNVPSAHAYNHESVRQFRRDLEEWNGAALSDDAIQAAIERRQDNAKAMRAILDWRRHHPPGISGCDALAILGSAMMMEAAEHGAFIRHLLESGPSSRAPGLRVFVGGSPPDNDTLYRSIEAFGATVVGEDHDFGERWVDDAGDAVAADAMTFLADRWDAATGFVPVDRMGASLVDRVRASRADIVILNVYRNDETQIWDTPSQLQALEAAGIPVLHLAGQPHIISDFEGLRARIAEALSAVSRMAA